jgi:hypothetical protein
VSSGDVPRLQGALQVGAGLGVGAEGLTTHSTDGVFYLEGQLIAYAADAYAGNSCGTPCRGAATRIGWGVRAHIPFYLVPGDTIATAVAWPFFPDAYFSLVLRAAQGSLWWRFERLHSGPTVSWQIVAGREAALFFSSSQVPGQDFEMTELELPLLEVRTKHLFSERLGEEVSLQLGGTLQWTTLQWTTLDSSHRTFAPSVFARLAFDGIVYVVP